MDISIVSITDPSNPNQNKAALAVAFAWSDIQNNRIASLPVGAGPFAIVVGGSAAYHNQFFFAMHAGPAAMLFMANLPVAQGTPCAGVADGPFIRPNGGPSSGIVRAQMIWDGAAGLLYGEALFPI